MKTSLLLFSIIIFLFSSCRPDNEDAMDVFSKIYTIDNLPKEVFKINSSRDTTIRGKEGTILRIYKNTFVDSINNPVNGLVEIEFKEALKPYDFILANLTTTSNGKTLQSGGMIYLNASINGKQLSIAKDKIIGLIIPCINSDTSMMVYEGNIGTDKTISQNTDSSQITMVNWINPKPMLNDSVKRIRNIGGGASYTYQIEEYYDLTEEQRNSIGYKIDIDSLSGNDTSVVINGSHVKIFNIQKGQLFINGSDNGFIREFQNGKGTNFFTEDPGTNYIFSMKKLGWANIDKLDDDPRTKEIDLITSIKNQADFKTIYVSLCISDRGMYLPGYQKKDETFCFTHGDFEKTRLPVGAKGTIIATAYKNDRPFFAIEHFTVSEKQTISIELSETTMDNLKKKLEKNL